MSEPTASEDTHPSSPRRKSLAVAYLLLPLGFIGVHRMYLGRWMSAVAYIFVYLIALAELGLEDGGIVLLALLLGMIVDAVLLPWMVKQTNRKIEAEYLEHPEFFEISEDESIAPWARAKQDSWFQKLYEPLRVFQFLILCVLFTYVMVFIENNEFILFLVIILLGAGLITSLDQLVIRYPALRNLPGFEDALDRVVEMRNYYWHNEPRLTGALIGMVTRARTEYKPYWKMVGLMAIAIILDAFLSFRNDYAPHLTLEDVVAVLLVHLYLVLQTVFFVLSPVSALSFHYSLSGKRLRLGALSVIAILLIGFTYKVALDEQRMPGHVSYFSDWRLELRMGKPKFQEKLYESTSMVLFYSYYKPEYPYDNSPAQCGEEIKNSSPCEPTKKLREVLQGLAPNSESGAFDVFDTTYPTEDNPNTQLRMVRYKPLDQPITVVSVIDDEGGMCSRYMPPEPPDWYSEEDVAFYEVVRIECLELIDYLDENIPQPESLDTLDTLNTLNTPEKL